MTAAPAIVVVVVDQLAARWLDVAWDGAVPMPNLSALRDRGAVFRRAFTTTPVCTPARATMLTGLRPGVHGARDTGYRLDPALDTYPRLLRDAGWRTGAFGKLHLVPQLETASPDYTEYGFEVAEITEDTRVGAWLDWVRSAHPEHLTAALATVWATDGPAVVGDPSLADEIAAARTAHPDVAGRAYVLPLPAEVSQTAWITDRACDFIRGTPVAQPLLAHVGYVQPHDPFAPPGEYVDLVDPDLVPAPVPADWIADPIPYYRGERYSSASYRTADWRRERVLYLAELAFLDAELGRVLATLSEAARDTLVVFTADHGELLHDHGLIGKGERHYDAAIRIPLVIAGSRVPRGERRDLVDSTDLAPTVLDWAGVPAPEAHPWPSGSPIPLLPGHALLRGETGRESVYVESSTTDSLGSVAGWSRTLRTVSHRYTRHLGGGGEQLFAIETDPDEQLDLARDPTYAELRNTLESQLLDAIATAEAPMPPRGLFRPGAW